MSTVRADDRPGYQAAAPTAPPPSTNAGVRLNAAREAAPLTRRETRSLAQRRMAEQRIIMETTSAIAGAADLPAAVRMFVSGVQALTGAESGSVRLLTSAPNASLWTYRVYSWRGAVWQQRDERYQGPGGDAARMLVSKRGEYLADTATAAATGDAAAALALQRLGVRSSLKAPLRAGGRVIGVVYADSSRPHAFSSALLPPLQLLADHTGAAVEQARLRSQAAERLTQLEVAGRVATAVNAAGDLDGMLRRILEEAVAVAGAHRGTVALVDENRRFVRGRIGLNQPPGIVEDTVRRLYLSATPKEDIYAIAVRTGEQMVVDDRHPALHQPTRLRYPNLRKQWRVLTPIPHAGAVIGILSIVWDDVAPSSDSMAILRLIAEQTGGAVGRARLAEAERGQLLAREAAVRAQLRAEAQFGALLESAPDAVVTATADGRITRVNRRAEEQFGYSRAELLGQPLTLLMPAFQGLAAANASGARAAATGRLIELQGQCKDGRLFPIEVSLATWEADGTTYLSGIIRDSTQRKRTEAILAWQYREAETARTEARAILDATSEAMVLIAPEGRILALNRRTEEFFGLEPDRVVGLGIAEIQEEVHRIFGATALQTLTERLADDQNQFTAEFQQRWPEPRELQVYSTPVRGTDDRVLGRLFAFRDVTREREVDRMKSEFVSLVSHELRTPLTSIKGYIDLLAAGEVGEVSAEQLDFLEVVKSNADRLVSLINDLLDISRIEAGKVELQRSPLEVGRLVEAVVASFRPQLEIKQQTLHVAIPPALPEVLGDGDRLTQVFTNLLSNAHKYTLAAGRIDIVAEVAGDELRITVSDSGIGMTKQDLAHLFTRFFRAENRATREVGGTGLGLAISRSLIELHGGRIDVRSTPGHGSAFTVSLPTVSPAER